MKSNLSFQSQGWNSRHASNCRRFQQSPGLSNIEEIEGQQAWQEKIGMIMDKIK